MPTEVPDGIFDFVRAVSTLSGFKVIWDTVVISWQDLFYDPCPNCYGTGLMTCPFCRGSKTLRSRPQRLVENSRGQRLLLHLPEDLHECFYCGYPQELDFTSSMTAPDINDETYTLRVIENFNKVMAGRPPRFTWDPTAGTIHCPLCDGSQYLQRITPSLNKVFGMEDDLWLKITKRVGVPTTEHHSASDFKPRKVEAFLEFPDMPPPFPEDMVEYPASYAHPILMPRPRRTRKWTEEEIENYQEPADDVVRVDLGSFILPQLNTYADLPIGAEKAFP